MGLFEQNPFLLLPFILLIVIGYDIVKWALLRILRERQASGGEHDSRE